MEDTSRKASRKVLGQALLCSDKTAVSDAPQQREQRPQRLHDFSSAAVGDNPTMGSISPRSYDFLAEDGHAAPATSPGKQNEGDSSPFSEKRSTTVAVILRQLATGSSISAQGEQWKLTRAVAHLEDAWKGRMSPCPPLDQENVRKMFKIRWKYRKIDFLLVHLLLVLSVLEIPAWCVANKKCFWTCYPDFSRNWHMSSALSLVIEGVMVSVLVLGALLDVHIGGRDYWQGVRSAQYQLMWFKHGTLALYGTIYLLSLAVDYRAHSLCAYCRILLYLSVHRRTFLVVTQLRHILGAVAEIWMLIFLNIIMFAWVGMILFAGTSEGSAVFPDLFESSWRLFVLFTTTNFPSIMMTAYESVRATIIYFAGFVVLNVFFLAPLSLAFIFNVFRGGQKGIPLLEEDIRLSSSMAAFALLDDRNTGQVSMANIGAFLLEVHSMQGLACREVARLQDLMEEASARTPEAPSFNMTDFKDAVRVMDRSLMHAEWITEVQWYRPQLYKSPGFRRLTRVVKHQRITLWPGLLGTPPISMLLMDFVDSCLLVTSFIALFVATPFDSARGIVRYDWVQIAVVAGFCLTTGFCAVVRGWHNCVQRPTWVFNVVITSASVLVVCMACSYGGYLWGWRVMRALRVIHLSLAVAFVPRLGFLIRTLLIMTKRAATPASVLLAWALFMAVLGTQIFGGAVCVPSLASGNSNCNGTTVGTNKYTESGLTLLNFNDVPTALVTLLVLFVVNDWYVIVDEFVDVTNSGWSRTFFIVNYIMGVAVILNLVVTVVINSFWDEYKTSENPALALRQLQDSAAASARPPVPDTPGAAAPDDGGGAAGGALGGVGGGGGGRGGGGALVTEITRSDTDVSGSSLENGGLADPRYSPDHGGSWRVGFSHEEEGVEDAVFGTRGEGGGSRGGGGGGVGGGGGGSGVGGHNGGGGEGDVRLHRGHQPPQAMMPTGDQEGMEAERDIVRRASRRRLNVSGIA